VTQEKFTQLLEKYQSLEAKHEKLKTKGKHIEEANVKRLKLENNQLRKQMSINEQGIANNRARLVGAVKEKQALEK